MANEKAKLESEYQAQCQLRLETDSGKETGRVLKGEWGERGRDRGRVMTRWRNDGQRQNIRIKRNLGGLGHRSCWCAIRTQDHED